MENLKMISEFMKGYDFEHTEGGLPLGDFSNSWEWLMPVVRECFDNGAEGDEIGDITHALLDCDRDATYKAVVKFINQLKPIKMDNLVDSVIDQIKEDINGGDLTAIDELLRFVPKENLIGYLPEEI